MFWFYLFFGAVLWNSWFPEKFAVFWIKRYGLRVMRFFIHHIVRIFDDGRSALASWKNAGRNSPRRVYVTRCHDTLARVKKNLYQGLCELIKCTKVLLQINEQARVHYHSFSTFSLNILPWKQRLLCSLWTKLNL